MNQRIGVDQFHCRRDDVNCLGSCASDFAGSERQQRTRALATA